MLISAFEFFAQIAGEWSAAIFAFSESLSFDLYFGDTLLSLLLEIVYSFSVAFVFVLPFIVVYLVIKWLFAS